MEMFERDPPLVLAYSSRSASLSIHTIQGFRPGTFLGPLPSRPARSRTHGWPLKPLRQLGVLPSPLCIPVREPEQADVFPKQNGLDSLDVSGLDVADPILGCAKPVGNVPYIQPCRFSGSHTLAGNCEESNDVFDTNAKISRQLDRRPAQ